MTAPSTERAWIWLVRALLLGCTIELLVEADGSMDPHGRWVAGGAVVLLAAHVLTLLRARARSAPCAVPVATRLRAALAGAAGAVLASLAIAAFLAVLVPGSSFPEQSVDARRLLPHEAGGMIVVGVTVSLLAPACAYAREAGDPVGALLGWTLVPLAPLACYFTPNELTFTHFGSPKGWGRLALLGLAFGLGWSWVACARPGVVLAGSTDRRASSLALDLPYATALALALLALLFAIGAAVELPRRPVGLYAYPVVILASAYVVEHWTAHASRRPRVEVARAALLAAPISLAFTAASAWAVPDWASVAAPWQELVLVPLPIAATGTVWFVAAGVVLVLRLRSVSTPDHGD